MGTTTHSQESQKARSKPENGPISSVLEMIVDASPKIGSEISPSRHHRFGEHVYEATPTPAR